MGFYGFCYMVRFSKIVYEGSSDSGEELIVIDIIDKNIMYLWNCLCVFYC